MNKVYLNVLTIGKSGVGKSSLINYLFDTDKCKTGSGEPQTKKLFETISYEYSEKITLRLTDTKGLEPNDYNNWVYDLRNNIIEKEKLEIDKQYHAILYCINAGSDRIETAELKIISELYSLFPIGVVLTHCIKGKIKESVEGIKRTLIDYGIKKENIFEVCNIKGTLLSGEKLEQFGKEKLIEYINNSFYEKIIKSFPITFEKIIDSNIEEYKRIIYLVIDKNINFFNGNSNKNYQKMEEIIKEKVIECQECIDEKLKLKTEDVFQKYQIIYDTFFIIDPNNEVINYSSPKTYNFNLQKELPEIVGENVAVALFMLVPVLNAFIPHFVNNMHREDVKNKVDIVFEEVKKNELRKTSQIIDLLNIH